MSDPIVDKLLGGDAPDPGCDACFEVLDAYAEAVLHGADVERVFPQMVAHLTSCSACREDTEGLIAFLRAGVLPEDPA